MNDLRCIHPSTPNPPNSRPPMAAPMIAPTNVPVEMLDETSTNQNILRGVTWRWIRRSAVTPFCAHTFENELSSMRRIGVRYRLVYLCNSLLFIPIKSIYVILIHKHLQFRGGTAFKAKNMSWFWFNPYMEFQPPKNEQFSYQSRTI